MKDHYDFTNGIRGPVIPRKKVGNKLALNYWKCGCGEIHPRLYDQCYKCNFKQEEVADCPTVQEVALEGMPNVSNC